MLSAWVSQYDQSNVLLPLNTEWSLTLVIILLSIFFLSVSSISEYRTVSRGIFSSLLSDKCIEAGLDSPACNPKTQRKMLYEKPVSTVELELRTQLGTKAESRQ